MTAPAAKRVAEVLAQQLGLEAGDVESTIAADPITAAFALSLMAQPPSEDRGAAATVRFVASLVGACPLCLGEDDGCPECGGRGTPGCREPAGEALIVWIARPLRRMGLCVGRLRERAATHDHEGGIR
jgi:hypothetical protein